MIISAFSVFFNQSDFLPNKETLAKRKINEIQAKLKKAKNRCHY